MLAAIEPPAGGFDLGGGRGTGFLAVSSSPLANSMTWPWWMSQCRSEMMAVASGDGSRVGRLG